MQVFLVGGAVRDEILGREVKDRDYVVVGATPQEMMDQGFEQVGADFPVFLHPETREEYALARTERKTGTGYKGFETVFDPDVTLEEDLKRRDLTINAMAKNLETGEIIDPFGGQEDIRQKRLVPVSGAFVEDPMRILRVARFQARLGNEWKIDRAITHYYFKELMNNPYIDNNEFQGISVERYVTEITKALDETHWYLFWNNSMVQEAVNSANFSGIRMRSVREIPSNNFNTKLAIIAMSDVGNSIFFKSPRFPKSVERKMAAFDWIGRQYRNNGWQFEDADVQAIVFWQKGNWFKQLVEELIRVGDIDELSVDGRMKVTEFLSLLLKAQERAMRITFDDLDKFDDLVFTGDLLKSTRETIFWRTIEEGHDTFNKNTKAA